MRNKLFSAFTLIAAIIVIALNMKQAPSTSDQIHLNAMHAEPVAAEIKASKSEAAKAALMHGPEASTADQAKVKILEEILTAKNDNDPRMDTELKQLSPATKHLMRERYLATAAEKRNERGTIVFLLGRNITSPEDVGFMHNVLNEAPCRSLENCEKESTGSVSAEDRHYEGMNEVTLAYPQLMALKALESYLKTAGGNGELSPTALAELEDARRSSNRKIASMAEDLSRQFTSSGSRQ